MRFDTYGFLRTYRRDWVRGAFEPAQQFGVRDRFVQDGQRAGVPGAPG